MNNKIKYDWIKTTQLENDFSMFKGGLKSAGFCVYVMNTFLSVRDCGSLSSPTDGSVDQSSGTTEGKVASFSCSTGYTLSGATQRTCQSSGSWTDSQPSCLSKLTCPRTHTLPQWCHPDDMSVNLPPHPVITVTRDHLWK